MIQVLILILTIIIIVAKIIDIIAIPTFLIFLVLKLCGVIAWSWLLVCMPLIVLAGSLVLSVIGVSLCD